MQTNSYLELCGNQHQSCFLCCCLLPQAPKGWRQLDTGSNYKMILGRPACPLTLASPTVNQTPGGTVCCLFSSFCWPSQTHRQPQIKTPLFSSADARCVKMLRPRLPGLPFINYTQHVPFRSGRGSQNSTNQPDSLLGRKHYEQHADLS
jgi:hypothetical protein